MQGVWYAGKEGEEFHEQHAVSVSEEKKKMTEEKILTKHPALQSAQQEFEGQILGQHKLVRRNRQTRPGSQEENRANFFKTSKISPEIVTERKWPGASSVAPD
jgi:hypothetical protein